MIETKIAWLHRCEDIYLTDEQYKAQVEFMPPSAKSYIKFIDYDTFGRELKLHNKAMEEMSVLRGEIRRLGMEVEELMKVDYWSDRHDIVAKDLKKTQFLLDIETTANKRMCEALQVYAEIDESWWSLFRVALFNMKIGHYARHVLELYGKRKSKD